MLSENTHAENKSMLQPLLVTLTLNGIASTKIYRCYQDEKKQVWAEQKDLNALGFPITTQAPIHYKDREYVLLDWYENIEYALDEHALILIIKTPLAWHKKIIKTKIKLDNVGLRPQHSGAFFNYDANSRFNGWTRKTDFASFTEAGLFTPYGVGTSSVLLNGYDFFQCKNGVTRLETSWTIDEPEHIASWRFGDSISSGLVWNGAVRFAGVQYATNFTTQPSLITFPQPVISGEAILPSSIDVLVNGMENYRQSVERGTYYLAQLPVITGAGTIQVMAKDMLGREQISTFSYYAAPVLLKPGLADYSFEVGSMRSWYGTRNYQYGQALGVATYSLGLTEHDTAGVHLELLKEHQTLGFSNHYLLGTVGVLSVGVAGSHTAKTKSWSDGQIKRGLGGLMSVGFRRQTTFLSYGAQATVANHDYFQIGTFRNKGYPNFTLQSFVGLSTEHWGAVSLTYTALNNAFNPVLAAPYEYLLPNSQVLMLSYSKNLFKRVFFTVSGLSDLRERNSQQIFATLSIPLDGGNKSISLNEYSQSGQHQENIQLIKNLPLGNGYGYRFTAADNKSSPVIGEANWQTNQGLLGARYINTNGGQYGEVNARGSVINFAHRTFFARYVDQSFALVDASGFHNAEVLYRNQPIGKTNKAGYLYVPQLLAYQPNEIKLDTSKLPLTAQIKEASRTVTPYRRSGVLVKFDLFLAQNILLTLHQNNGEPVPAGAVVYMDEDPAPIPVGYYGQAFISSQGGTRLSGTARWEEQMCHFSIDIPASGKAVQKERTLCN
ncbi:fimbria/pilus outer membrane usher protein [Legionella lytica]|uniref:Fimbria/pilus outer membrane usher protein n=1 Tax=Legionella lytica TaxID=96232 RepID=A0ABW8D914_9GAMM